MTYKRNDCFAMVDGECDCLQQTKCENCNFYKKRSEVDMGEILRIRYFSNLVKERYGKRKNETL